MKRKKDRQAEKIAKTARYTLHTETNLTQTVVLICHSNHTRHEYRNTVIRVLNINKRILPRRV